MLKQLLHLNFLVGQMSDSEFLLKNHSLFTHFNSKSKLGLKTYKQNPSQKILLRNFQINHFLNSKLYKNKQNSLRKQQLATRLYYNIAISVLLRKLKKKKIQGAKSRLFRRKLKFFRKKLRLKTKLKPATQYTNFLGKNKFLRNKNQSQIIKHIKKIN